MSEVDELSVDHDVRPVPGHRLASIRRDPSLVPGAKPQREPLKEVQPKHRLLVEYMTIGCPHADIVSAIGKEVCTPLSLEDAADLLRLRRRYARRLFEEPLFRTELSRALDNLRKGESAAAVHTMIAVMKDPGLKKAADRKVQLTAAQAILGEGDGNRSGGTTVNVFNGGQQITAGIVVRLPPNVPRTALDAKVIDHEE